MEVVVEAVAVVVIVALAHGLVAGNLGPCFASDVNYSSKAAAEAAAVAALGDHLIHYPTCLVP